MRRSTLLEYICRTRYLQICWKQEMILQRKRLTTTRRSLSCSWTNDVLEKQLPYCGCHCCCFAVPRTPFNRSPQPRGSIHAKHYLPENLQWFAGATTRRSRHTHEENSSEMGYGAGQNIFCIEEAQTEEDPTRNQRTARGQNQRPETFATT